MSIFSRLLGSKKAAEAQKAKQKEEASKPPPKPYRHVPQHAARDSMNLGPSVWQSREDRDRRQSASIRTMNTQYNRRSGMTRNNSALSNVTTIHRDNSINGRSEYTSTQNQRRPRLTAAGSTVTFADESIPPVPLKNTEKVEVIEKSENSPVSPISPDHSIEDSRSSSSSSQVLELAPWNHPNDQPKQLEQNFVDRSALPPPQLPRTLSNDNVNKPWERKSDLPNRSSMAPPQVPRTLSNSSVNKPRERKPDANNGPFMASSQTPHAFSTDAVIKPRDRNLDIKVNYRASMGPPQLPQTFSLDSSDTPAERKPETNYRTSMAAGPSQFPRTFSSGSITKPWERKAGERASMMGPPSVNSSQTTSDRALKPWEIRSSKVPEIKVQAEAPKKRDSRRWTFSKRHSTAIAAH